MRIAILTSGRFHVCDLARELDALGHDVLFYSCVPKFVTRRFGLPDRCNRSLFPILAPLFFLMRKTHKTKLRAITERLFIGALDALAARVIKPCDVFIGMSGMCTKTAVFARQKYNAKVWIERGSRHILSQQEILAALPACRQVACFSVQREMADYALADTIVIPALHVERSFTERTVPHSKLFRNPYGVDFEMFPPTTAPVGIPPTIIMAGNWSFQKGCDVLVQAWRQLPGTRLVHVGAISDCPLPMDMGFEHHHHVPQWQLREFYGHAHVFAFSLSPRGLGPGSSPSFGLWAACSLHRPHWRRRLEAVRRGSSANHRSPFR